MSSPRKGRRAIIALTDGQENASTRFRGLQELLDKARNQGVTVSTIGLGYDVEAGILRRFEETGGVYLFSPSATELADVFSQQVELLDRELYFEFEAGPATGTRSSLQATFHVGGDRVDSSPKSYVRFGFIPIVRGNHAQFFLAVFALLLLPLACQMSWNALTTHDFRSRNVRCLEEGDAEIGQRDCNMSLDEPGFESGEIVVSCPSCSRVHHARSWRLNRCECPYSDGGKGSYCYSRHMPTLLRRLLNFLCRPLGSRPDGPMFRCRCAGDEKGY